MFQPDSIYLVLSVFLIFILYLIIAREIDLYRYNKREKDLLNRIMSQDFPDYVQGVKLLEKKVNDKIRDTEQRDIEDKDILQVV